MAKRHNNALVIQHGACNPSGIVLAIADACKEIRAEKNYSGTIQITSDPAIRLMVHQLAFICNVGEIDDSLSLYIKLREECQELGKSENRSNA